MTANATLDLADRYFSALTDLRFDDLSELCSPDLAVWHNFTGKTQTFDENARMLRWVGKRLVGYRYENVVRSLTAGGFVQQHILCGQADDFEVRVPACIVAEVKDGKISRMQEYLNGADLGPLNG